MNARTSLLYRRGALTLLFLCTANLAAQPCTVDTFAGGDSGVDPGLLRPERLDEGPDGSIFIADQGRLSIQQIHPDGSVTTRFELASPASPRFKDFAVAPNGDLFVAKQRIVYRVTPDGNQTPFLGVEITGWGRCEPGACAVGTTATLMELGAVNAVDVDRSGNLFAAVRGHNGARFLVKVAPDGAVSAPAVSTNADTVYVDPQGRAHIVDQRWVVVHPGGTVEVNQELTDYSGNGWAIAMAADGTLYISNQLSGDSAVARYRPGPLYDALAGGLDAGSSGDGGPASEARFGSVRGLLLTGDDSLYISDWENHRVRRIRHVSQCPTSGTRPLPARNAFLNAASYEGLSPGAIVSIFGVRLGPTELRVAQALESGLFPTQLGGVRVLFDGTAAPLLFVSGGQIGAVVPFQTKVNVEVSESGVWTTVSQGPRIVVETETGRSDERELTMLPASPAVFTLDGSGRGPAAALNQDGSLNSAANPARKGEIVSLWATGFGKLTPSPQDGAILTGENLPGPALPVTVLLSGEPLETLYVGAAPGLVAGAIQINVRILPSQGFVGDTEVTIEMADLPPHRGVILYTAE